MFTATIRPGDILAQVMEHPLRWQPSTNAVRRLYPFVVSHHIGRSAWTVHTSLRGGELSSPQPS